MKKNSGIFAFLTIMFSSLVTAGPVEGLQQLLGGLGELIVILIQFISNTILDINSFDEFLFAKILLFTLILTIVYTVIKQNHILGGERNKPVVWIISVSIAILSIRYLSDEFIEAILLQYGALAIGITVFLPLAIYFFFLHQSGIGPFGRRAGWIVFATAFFALWSFRYEEVGSANVIYWIGIGFIIISMIFDKSIHRYFSFADFRKFKVRHRSKMKRNLMRDLKILDEDLANGIIQKTTYDRETREIQDKINDLSD